MHIKINYSCFSNLIVFGFACRISNETHSSVMHPAAIRREPPAVQRQPSNIRLPLISPSLRCMHNPSNTRQPPRHTYMKRQQKQKQRQRQRRAGDAEGVQAARVPPHTAHGVLYRLLLCVREAMLNHAWSAARALVHQLLQVHLPGTRKGAGRLVDACWRLCLQLLAEVQHVRGIDTNSYATLFLRCACHSLLLSHSIYSLLHQVLAFSFRLYLK